MCIEFCRKHSEKAYFLLRVAVGVLFLYHGITKLGGMAGTAGFFGNIGIPAPALFAWVVALTETLGGAMLILGLFTRIASIPLAITMLVAAIMVHIPKGFGNTELVMVLFFAVVLFGMMGPGKISLDARYCRKCL
jgi:putative oxidoreductase